MAEFDTTASESYRNRLQAASERLQESALDIIKQADLSVTTRGMVDPKILALSLLSRTLSHFRGLTVLIKAKMVVEARILARCCFENLYMVGGLHAEGDSFAKRMIEDDQAGRKGRLRFAKETETILETLPSELQESVNERLEVFKTGPRVTFLNPKDASNVGPFKETYIAYSQFSGDAAHPTISALARHWSRDECSKTTYFNAQPEPNETELDQTLEMASIALIGMAVTVNEMVGYTEAGKALPAINHEMKVLQAERWGPQSVAEGMDIRVERPQATGLSAKPH